MQGGRDPFFGFGDPFGSFSGFGGQRSMISGIFGGRDPFDDPFFTQPFGSMFGSSFFSPHGGPFMNSAAGGPFMNSAAGGPFANSSASGFLEHRPSPSNVPRGPIIEELKSDDEKDEDEGREEKKVNPRKHGRSSKEPIVEDPDDEAAEKKSKHMPRRDYLNLVHQGRPASQTRNFTYQSSSVTYGGGNGGYYSTSSTRRSGSDGLAFEEFREANSVTGEATHRISKGMHEKGHSHTRKLNSDGHVGSMYTLHNLNEDELVGFNEAWSGNARRHLPGWSEHFTRNAIASGGNQHAQRRRGWALPSPQPANNMGGRGVGQSGRMRTHIGDGTGSPRLGSNGSGNPHQVNRH